MEITVILLITFVMSLIQISLWLTFPKIIRDIVMSNPIFAGSINLLGSWMILLFTGITQLVGVCNLFASLVFMLFAYIYKRRMGIVGLSVNWLKVLWILPIIPIIKVNYEKGA